MYDKEEYHYDETNTVSDMESVKIKRGKRMYYPTKFRGRIVNAMSGLYYPFCQGSHEELRLYKVIDTRGICDSNGYKRKRRDVQNKDPNFLYFDGPDQYAYHMKTNLNQNYVQQWKLEKDRLFPDNGNFVKNEWEKLKLEKHEQMTTRKL